MSTPHSDLLPDALKATSTSFTARHDRLLRSITQCPPSQLTKPILCIMPYPSIWTARIIPLTRRPSHAFATAIGILRRSIFVSLPYGGNTIRYLRTRIAEIDHIRHFVLLLHEVRRCRISGGWPAILLSKAVSGLTVGTMDATWPAFPHSRL